MEYVHAPAHIAGSRFRIARSWPRLPTNLVSRVYRRHHRLVWLAVGLNVAFMLAFTLLVSPFHGPDEPAHFDMIHQYQQDPALRQPDKAIKFVTIGGPIDHARQILSPAPYGRKSPRLQAGDAVPRPKRPPADLGGRNVVEYNQMTQHPPLYYVVLAGLTSAITRPGSFWSWDRELLLARLFSVLFVAPLALLASGAALALGLSRRAAAIAAAFTLLVPAKSVIGAVVNNDSLVILLAGIGVVAALRYLAGGRPREAWVASAAGGALALTKSSGAVVAAWVGLVIAYGAYERWKRGERGDLRRTLIPSAVFIAIGSSWYVANLIQFHRPQPHPQRHITDPVPSSFWKFLPQFFDVVSRTFWGLPAPRLGIGLPWWASHTLSLLTITAIVVAFVVARPLRRYLVALLTLCILQGALLLQTTWLTNRVHPRGQPFAALQGRYLFPLLVPLAVFVAVAASGVLARFSPRVLLNTGAAVFGIGFVLHARLGQLMLESYWQAPGVSLARHLHAVVSWSPLPQLATYAVLALPAVVMAVAVARACAFVWSGDDAEIAPGVSV